MLKPILSKPNMWFSSPVLFYLYLPLCWFRLVTSNFASKVVLANKITLEKVSEILLGTHSSNFHGGIHP